jgi:hypothetical protein
MSILTSPCACGGCRKFTEGKIVCEENNRKMIFHNPSAATVEKLRIDGCRIKDSSQRRCDYLVIANNKFHFVELKGKNIKHAIEQIEAMLKLPEIKNAGACEMWGFVICTAVSPSFRTKSQNEKSRFRKIYNARLEIRSRCHEHELR